MFNNKTVTFGVDQLVNTCECDITPKTCDYYCCCDVDCPTTITKAWINSPGSVCANQRILLFNLI